MERKLACFPVWNGRIAPLFDAARFWVLRELGEGASEQETVCECRSQEPYKIVNELLQLGVGRLVCGAISKELLASVQSAGIEVEAFICGCSDEIITHCVTGQFNPKAYAMPGCCKRRRAGKTKGVYL
jgi:hypothetical protein